MTQNKYRPHPVVGKFIQWTQGRYTCRLCPLCLSLTALSSHWASPACFPRAFRRRRHSQRARKKAQDKRRRSSKTAALTLGDWRRSCSCRVEQGWYPSRPNSFSIWAMESTGLIWCVNMPEYIWETDERGEKKFRFKKGEIWCHIQNLVIFSSLIMSKLKILNV